MYSCPNRKESRAKVESKPALQACTDMAWNTDSNKYLQQRTVDGHRVQILTDTGCDQTIVSANKVRLERVSRGDSVPVLCVHSDTMQYPTAEVEIKMGHWVQRVKVAIAPSLPVDVLLGRDIFCPEVGQQLGLGLAVVTRSQARQGLPQGVTPPPLGHDSGDVEARGEEPPCDQLPCGETACADNAGTRVEEPLSVPTSNGNSSSVDSETRGEEPQCEQQSGDLVGPEAPSDSSSSVPGESPIVLSDCDEDSPLAHVTKAELQEWQEQDPTLRQAREVAYPEEGDQLGEERVGFLYRDGLLYRRWRPKGTELGDV